jgi:hypothetical protein
MLQEVKCSEAFHDEFSRLSREILWGQGRGLGSEKGMVIESYGFLSSRFYPRRSWFKGF